MIIFAIKVIFLKSLILMFFSLLECKKRKTRYHCKRKNCKIKRKICTEKRVNTSLKDLSIAFNNHGQHRILLVALLLTLLLSFLSSLSIAVHVI